MTTSNLCEASIDVDVETYFLVDEEDHVLWVSDGCGELTWLGVKSIERLRVPQSVASAEDLVQHFRRTGWEVLFSAVDWDAKWRAWIAAHPVVVAVA